MPRKVSAEVKPQRSRARAPNERGGKVWCGMREDAVETMYVLCGVSVSL